MSFFSWIASNWIEVLGTIFGIAYVILSIKQSIVTWLFGLLTSLLYIYVFFKSAIYAQMTLQFYYVFISVYAWFLWAKGTVESNGKKHLQVSHLNKSQILIFSGITLLIWVTINLVLRKFTDSSIPIADSFIAALSITATWLLANKKIENWLIWIAANSFSVGLYIYQNMYPTAILFVFYLAAAFWGYFEWKNDYRKNNS